MKNTTNSKSFVNTARRVILNMANPRDGLPYMLALFREGVPAIEWTCEDGYTYLFDSAQDVILCAQVFNGRYPGLLVQTALVAYSLGLDFH